MTRHELYFIQDYLIESIQQVDFPGSGASFRYIDPKIVNGISDVKIDLPYEQRTTISPDYSLDDVVCVLSDGLADRLGFESVDYDNEAYRLAKQTLSKLGVKDEEMFHELVQAQMLYEGHSLILIEEETHVRYELTLQKLIKALDKVVADTMKEYACTKLHAIRVVFEEGDFYTFNGILQTAIFGEVIYG